MKFTLIFLLISVNAFSQSYDEDAMSSLISERGSVSSSAPESFKNCDSQTYINLEEERPYQGAKFKGPFHNIPRDNQDGIGSCYANTAKNFIVALSGGKDIASFLDIALASKEEANELIQKGLEGGQVCQALNAIQKKGYCPQNLAPLERGDSNPVTEKLFNMGSLQNTSYSIIQMKDFLQNLDQVKKSNSAIKEQILNNSKQVVEKLKATPDIKFPLPVLRVDVPLEWKLREIFSTNKNRMAVTEEKFVSDFKEAYKSFKPVFFKAVIQGKNLDEIFDEYSRSMGPFFSKHNLTSELAGIKKLFKIDADRDFKNPRYKQQIKASVDFLKTLMDKKSLSDEEFSNYCVQQEIPALELVNNLYPLVESIKASKLNGNMLFDRNGKFKSALELTQLAVAPACLNPGNRKAVPAFTCKDDYNGIDDLKRSGKPQQEQLKSFREKILSSLYQGYPVGNTFKRGPNDYHINTIVGLRLNPTTRQCEFLIRESQNGTSTWQGEGEIYKKVLALSGATKK